MTTGGRPVPVDDIDPESGGVKCQGCKGVASRLDIGTALRLRGGDEWLAPPAFECSRCRVIIFESEFEEGRFVPPQFKVEGVPGRAKEILFVLKVTRERSRSTASTD